VLSSTEAFPRSPVNEHHTTTMSEGIGIANLPNQVCLSLCRVCLRLTLLQKHKIVAKRGAHFTIMVVGQSRRQPLTSRTPTYFPPGESGLGKTTLINTLFSTELSAPKNYNRRHLKQLDKLTEVEIIKAELEEKQFKAKLSVIDTPGFGDYVNNRDSWSPIVDFIDDQHEAYMRQEQQPQRTDKTDLRVHACLYFIRPTGHTSVPSP